MLVPKAPAVERPRKKAKDVLLLVEVAKTLLGSLIKIKVVNVLISFVAAKLFLGTVLKN